MKILLHIGAHKTGTSSIQFFMHENSARLLDAGIFYPRNSSLTIYGIKKYGHHALALSCKPRAQLKERIGLGFHGELKAILRLIEISSANLCVLSSEEFFVTDRQKIERLASILNGHDVRILAFVRRPDTMFMSIYSSRLTAPRAKKIDYRRFLAKPDRLSGELAYEAHLDTWASVFGRDAIDLRLVETGDSIDVMMTAIGIDPTGPIGLQLREGMPPRRNSRRNSSKSNETLAVLQLAKEMISDDSVFLRVRKYCRMHIPAAPAKPFLSPAVRRHIVGYFEQSNGRMFASFGYSSNPYSVENLSIADDAEFVPLVTTPRAQEILSAALRHDKNDEHSSGRNSQIAGTGYDPAE
jgi:hypothetical protein